MGTIMTVSAGICDESGGGAWSCKLSRGSRLARLRMARERIGKLSSEKREGWGDLMDVYRESREEKGGWKQTDK
ncbi:hypothetical protein DVH24_010288 [Malus domestica]|uniref:Uncharacterized protein n=1 Tax=Malus domestica TaxID=3750 RepID=A0A498JVI7_MALDO|nr:hypothetical protein DVH24_010288 [Malus domestica]